MAQIKRSSSLVQVPSNISKFLCKLLKTNRQKIGRTSQKSWINLPGRALETD